MSVSQTENNDAKVGVLSAIAAYTMWGFAPMYFKHLDSLSAMEVLMHRVVWSAVVLVLLIMGLRQFDKVTKAISSLKVMAILLAAGLLLGANWLLFIWAINNDHLLDASLGYYINPLINVLLGYVFLQERLRRLQLVAVTVDQHHLGTFVQQGLGAGQTDARGSARNRGGFVFQFAHGIFLMRGHDGHGTGGQGCQRSRQWPERHR